MFHKCFNSVSKVHWEWFKSVCQSQCFKVVCSHWNHRSYPSIRRACCRWFSITCKITNFIDTFCTQTSFKCLNFVIIIMKALKVGQNKQYLLLCPEPSYWCQTFLSTTVTAVPIFLWPWTIYLSIHASVLLSVPARSFGPFFICLSVHFSICSSVHLCIRLLVCTGLTCQLTWWLWISALQYYLAPTTTIIQAYIKV